MTPDEWPDYPANPLTIFADSNSPGNPSLTTLPLDENITPSSVASTVNETWTIITETKSQINIHPHPSESKPLSSVQNSGNIIRVLLNESYEKPLPTFTSKNENVDSNSQASRDKGILNASKLNYTIPSSPSSSDLN